MSVNLAKLHLVQRYTTHVTAKTRKGKEYRKEAPTGFCEMNDRECPGRAVALYADDESNGVQLCAAHEKQYGAPPTPEKKQQ